MTPLGMCRQSKKKEKNPQVAISKNKIQNSLSWLNITGSNKIKTQYATPQYIHIYIYIKKTYGYTAPYQDKLKKY